MGRRRSPIRRSCSGPSTLSKNHLPTKFCANASSGRLSCSIPRRAATWRSARRNHYESDIVARGLGDSGSKHRIRGEIEIGARLRQELDDLALLKRAGEAIGAEQED